MSVDLYFSIKDHATPTLKQILDTTEDLTSAFEESKKKVSGYEDELVDLKIGMTATQKAAREMQKEFEKTGTDEAKENWRKAAKELEGYRSKISDTKKELNEYRGAYKTLSSAMEEAGNKQSDMVSKLNNWVSTALGVKQGGSGSALSSLKQAGVVGAIGSMLGPGISDSVNAYLYSNMTSQAANRTGSIVSSALSGASAGAAVGTAIMPGVGTVIGGLGGAFLGGLSGNLSSQAQEKQEFEDFRKSKVQDVYSEVTSEYTANAESGKQLAQTREQIKLSLKALLKDEETANQLFKDVKGYANRTSYTIDELAGTTRLLSVGFKDTNDILNWMKNLTDASAAIGMDEGDMQEMTRALTKTKNLGKASREFLDMFSDRGVDVYGYLSESLNVSQEQLFSDISKGKVSASTVLTALDTGIKKNYQGSAEEIGQSSFAGKSATLAGLKADVFETSYGDAYNDSRMDMLDKQIAFYEGEYGEKITKLMQLMGQEDARLDNRKDEIEMNNLKFMVDQIDGTAYKKSMESAKTVASMLPPGIGGQISEMANSFSKGMRDINTAVLDTPVLEIQNKTAAITDSILSLVGISSDFQKQVEELTGYANRINGNDLYASYLAVTGKSKIDFFNSSANQDRNMKNKDALYTFNQAFASTEAQTNLRNSLERVMESGLEGADAAIKRWNAEELIRQKLPARIDIDVVPTVRAASTSTYLSGNAETVNTKVFSSLGNLFGTEILNQRSANLKKAQGNGHASGLTRVPYDNYPALLHQGERVLTAQETRQADRASGGIQVTITGNTFSVRSEQEREDFFHWLVEKINQAKLAQG